MMEKNLLKAADLFSGAGGLTLGLKKAGFSVIGAIELDDLAVESYKVNHPETKVWQQDIKKVSTKKFMKDLGIKKGELDLLAGCPPCQGFSAIHTHDMKNRVNDSRNDLIFEMYRFAKDLNPKTIMLENVPGLLKDGRFPMFKLSLEKLGYKLNYGVLNSSFFGVPQKRKRSILIGAKKRKIEFAKEKKTTKTVRSVISKLKKAGMSKDPLHDCPQKMSDKVFDLISLIPKDGGSRNALPEQYQLECHKKITGFKDVYGRMKWDDVAPTLTCGCVAPSKGRFLHPEENRAITLREAAMLQSFPKNYYFSLRKGKMSVARMIGNALPPEFIRRNALQIKNYLEEECS